MVHESKPPSEKLRLARPQSYGVVLRLQKELALLDLGGCDSMLDRNVGVNNNTLSSLVGLSGQKLGSVAPQV